MPKEINKKRRRLMKKTGKTKILATIISIMMIVSMIPMGAFAVSATPVGEAISSAADFAAMAADGTYYLAANIELSETYANEFTGTFDGNGKTITVNCPIFDRVTNGTVKNFTVNSATTLVVANGAVVCNVAKGATFKDITCNASITSTNTTDAHGLAAIVGTIAGNGNVETTITIENCVNTGILSGDASKTHAGAMIGYAVDTTNAQSVNIIIKDCRNEGKIDASKSGGMISYVQGVKSVTVTGCHNSGEMFSHGISAGMIAQVHKQCKTLYVENCTNSGKACGENNGYNGGIVGICQLVGNASGTVTFRSCFNSGNVIGKGTDSCGGIVGRHYGAIMEYCGNSGQIENANCVGGIVGYTQNANLIRYCYNVGTIKSLEFSSGIVAASTNTQDSVYGCYNSGVITMQDGHKDVYNIAQVVSAVKTASYGTYYNNFSKAGTEIPCVSVMLTPMNNGNHEFVEADLASGKLAYDINKAAGQTVFYQNINEGGATKDANPVLDPTHGYVFDYNGTLYSLAFFTVDGASIRLDPVNHGIRFSTAVNKADYEVLTAAGIALDFGTVITPDEYLKAAGNDFTALAEDKYLDVNSTATGTDMFKEVKGEDNDTYYFVCGSITGIKEANYDWDYSAIGYVTIGEATVYSANYTTRNAAYIANAAKNDPNGGYTAAELEIIESYLK